MAEEWVWDPPRLEVLELGEPEGLKQLVERYLDAMDGGEALAQILKVVGENEGARCFVERDYIDRDYRDEYANFYAQTYRSHLDRCQRLHFLSAAGAYIGYVVLRPIPGRLVSRTMVAPPPELRSFISCLAEDVASPHGGRFPIQASPFISQDFQYGVCAHAAIWIVAQYFHLRFGLPRLHMSDVVQASRSRPGHHRITPSRGLTASQLSGALDSLGMLPVSYQLTSSESRKDADGSAGQLNSALDSTGILPVSHQPASHERRKDADEVARCYLNSGIPLILSQGRHAQVLVGYFHDEEGKRVYIAQDDVRGPYRLLDGLDGADLLLIPSPGRIYLDPSAAQDAALFHFEDLMSREEVAKRFEGIDDEDLQLRAYVTEIAAYREGLIGRGVVPDARTWLNLTSGSHWVWIVELQDGRAAEKGRECVIGEMLVDATTDERNAHVLMGVMPGHVYRWREPKRGESSGPCGQTALFETGCAIHSVS